MGAGRDVVLLARTYAFAAARHGSHRRKGLAQEPYVNHLVEVAQLVAEATEGTAAALVAAAVLHDVVEDTRTTAEEVRDGFGEDVMTLVLEVTDDKTLPKAERKRRQVVDGPHKSARAKLIKLADKISNVSALLVSPPADWPVERKREYLDWARAVVAGLWGACPRLEAEFDEAAGRLERALAAEGAAPP